MTKLTVNLSEAARRRIDERSAALGLTRSAYVERLLAEEARVELDQLLEEGYRSTRAESAEFAERALPLAWEVAEHGDPAW